jgi:hypothetical protein
MLSFILCLTMTIAMMLLMERMVKPRAPSNRRFLYRLSLLSAMPAVVFYITIFMISYRPILSFGAALITFSTIILFNNAKYAALQEPLVFSDFALLRQVVQHPALYLKYIGVFNLLALAFAAVAGIVVDLYFEAPVIARPTLNDYFPTALYLFVVLGMIYSVTRGPLRGAFLQLLRRFGTETDVRRDIDKLSLVVCLIFYFLLANEKAPSSAPAKPAVRPVPQNWPTASMQLPPVIVVQSESFFDARRLHPSIPNGILSRWDALGTEAVYRGHLKVPAWGANTMRTEFAFLSGLPSEALGVHRFNPYLNLCKAPVWTLARQLRAMGYRTVCVHPYASSFFDRDKVFPNLGFDLFLDIESFGGAARFGPYICDRAVADKITAVLEGASAPQFIFAITMENHGKWERGRLDGDTLAAPNLPKTPLGSPELGMYLQHLANADAMAGRLTDYLRERPGDGVFCMFGDHVPSLPSAFGRADFAESSTDYLVWKKSGRQPRMLNVDVDVLGRLVLDAVLNEANHAAIRAQPSAV